MSSELNQGNPPSKAVRASGSEQTDLISTLEAQLGALKTARAEQAKAEADMLERQTQVARREADLAQRAAEVERREAGAKSADAELAGLRERLAAERREVEALAEKIRAERDGVQKLVSESAERARALDELARGLKERETAASEQSEQAEAARRRHEESIAELGQQRAEIERAAREREAESAETARSLDDAITHATQRAAELAKDREKFEIERQSQAARAAEREKALAAARADLEKAQAELKAKSGAAGKADAAQITAFQAQLKERDSALAQLTQERDRLDSELRAAGNRMAELERQAAEGYGAAEADPAELADLQEKIDKRDRAIDALRTKLEEAKAEIASLTDRLQSGPTDGAPAGQATDLLAIDARLAQRRERLHHYKTLLRDQSSKILQAKSALAKRAEQCEQVLGKRAELAQAKQALDARAARLDRSASRNKAAVALLCVVTTVAILGGLSWAVAKQAFPGAYLVQATIAAQSDGQPLEPEQLAAWQQSMMALTLDPVVMETVAERMKKRGIVDLSTPGDVMARLKTDLDASVPAPGEMVLSLRGSGSEATRRTLDTFLAAFIAIANESRERRADRASTAVTVKPSSDASPISRPHVAYAGAIWGASSALMLLVGAFIWSRLAQAKQKYDEHDPVMAAIQLEQSGWATSTRV